MSNSISISQPLLGWLCLAGALALTLFFPPGRKTSSHLISNLMIMALFVGAAYNLIPRNAVESDLAVIAFGAAAGLIAVFARSVLRWPRYFRGVVQRRTSPYYWYARALGPRRRRG